MDKRSWKWGNLLEMREKHRDQCWGVQGPWLLMPEVGNGEQSTAGTNITFCLVILEQQPPPSWEVEQGVLEQVCEMIR